MSGTVQQFEDLAVYRHARELVNEAYRITRLSAFVRDRSLVDQVRRAAISVASNIAEGYERGSNNELIHFLYIAKGSCGELRAQIGVAKDQDYLDENAYA